MSHCVCANGRNIANINASFLIILRGVLFFRGLGRRFGGAYGGEVA